MDINDLQATVTAGSCSSRVIFNVPKARSRGVEVEFEAAPDPQLRLRDLGSFNDSELRSTLTSTDADGDGQRRVGHRGGQPAADASRSSRSRPRRPTSGRCRPGSLAYVTGTLPAHRLALHAGRRPGPRHAQPAVVRRQHDRRPADGEHLHLRSRAAGLRHRQPARRRPSQRVGRGACSSTT